MDGVADRARKVMFVVSKTKQNLQVSKPDSFFLSRSASITVQTTLQDDVRQSFMLGQMAKADQLGCRLPTRVATIHIRWSYSSGNSENMVFEALIYMYLFLCQQADSTSRINKAGRELRATCIVCTWF